MKLIANDASKMLTGLYAGFTIRDIRAVLAALKTGSIMITPLSHNFLVSVHEEFGGGYLEVKRFTLHDFGICIHVDDDYDENDSYSCCFDLLFDPDISQFSLGNGPHYVDFDETRAFLYRHDGDFYHNGEIIGYIYPDRIEIL